MVEVLGVTEKSGRKVPASLLADIVSARYEELFSLVRHELKRSGCDLRISAGMVMTGGGSNIRGAIELAEMCFDMPVRHGFADRISGLTEAAVDPTLATGVGLLLHGFQQQYEGAYGVPSIGSHATGVWTRMKEWFNGNF